MNRKAIAVLVAATALGAARSVAQELSEADTATFVKARIIESIPPAYPLAALRQRQDGWVMLSFVISAAGEVEAPMIEDSSGIEALERAALESIRAWRYEPATRNGVPVEQSMTSTRINFRIDQANGATPAFRRKYREIAGLIDQGDSAAALPLLDDLEFGGRQNLYEDAWFWWLKYMYLVKNQPNDTEQMARALQLAVGYQEEFLPPDQFVAAAEGLYGLQLKLGELSNAGRTLERLRDAKTARRSPRYGPTVDRMSSVEMQIDELVGSSQVLAFKGEIGKHDYWVHNLLRRSFSMANVAGRVDVVDIRCDMATKRYDSFPLDAVWHVPQSWGKCGVYIKGELGTTFVFQEHPPEVPATTLSTD